MSKLGHIMHLASPALQGTWHSYASGLCVEACASEKTPGRDQVIENTSLTMAALFDRPGWEAPES